MNIQATRFSHQKLSQLLDHQGLRSDRFAERLGNAVRGKPFDRSYVSKLRSGEKPITDDIAAAAAELLNVPLSWLIADTADREPVSV